MVHQFDFGIVAARAQQLLELTIADCEADASKKNVRISAAARATKPATAAAESAIPGCHVFIPKVAAK